MGKSEEESLRAKRSAFAKSRSRSKFGEFKKEMRKSKPPTVAKDFSTKSDKNLESIERISLACRIECDRQQVGSVEHGDLAKAYNLTLTKPWQKKSRLSLEDIFALSSIVEPEKAKGLRRTPVTFSNGNSGLSPDLVPKALESLLEAQGDISLDYFVKEFLVIHPFLDGNGRTAFLLYNLLAKNLDYPAALPDYFG